MRINEFNNMDIPDEITPTPDYDVPTDLLVFMRNDPMFYRKNFYPALEQYKSSKDKGCLNKMVSQGLDGYVQKFNIPNPKQSLMNSGDMKELVAQIITDEMEDLDENK